MLEKTRILVRLVPRNLENVDEEALGQSVLADDIECLGGSLVCEEDGVALARDEPL